MIKEASLYKKLLGNRIMCRACARYCNIPEGKIGFCGIRQNINGKLCLLVYGKVIATHVDPIEKKPVTHYMPGSRIFSIGTTGCSWLCYYCQNYDISQRRKIEGIDMSPEEVVNLTEAYRCQGIAYTYNEPTIFIEFAHDTGVMARSKGLINIFVSNGYCTPDSVNMMNDFLNCITVDFKGNGEVNFLRRYVGIPNPEPIFQTLLEIRDKTKIHMEIGDNIDEARKLSEWIYENLGPDIPIHFLRFHPDYKLMHLPPTPIETLEKQKRNIK